MFDNWYLAVVNWFRDRSERRALMDDFNMNARQAFITGISPVNMTATVSRGNPAYKHQYSRWHASGFRISVFSGRQLQRAQIILLGEAILYDDILVRRLVVLGFDTLEIQCDIGSYGCQWKLRDYLVLGQGSYQSPELN